MAFGERTPSAKGISCAQKEFHVISPNHLKMSRGFVHGILLMDKGHKRYDELERSNFLPSSDPKTFLFVD